MYKFPICIILLALIVSCNKKDTSKDIPTPPSAPTVTSGLGNVRNWHGHHYYNARGVSFPTPINESWALPDTSFPVYVIDDTTVSCMGAKFKYESSDSAKQVHFFGMAKYYYLYGPGYGRGVAYFYALDSIVFLKYQDAHGTNNAWIKDDHYYTY